MWDPYDDGHWWKQRPSFAEPVAPPSTDICDPPLYCISINQEWLPYLAGAAMQLAQPSTWLVTSDADRTLALARATDLIAEIGNAMPCISPPPSPSGTSTSQQACNIAGYLAHAIIKAPVQQAVDAYNADQTILGYGSTILSVIPGAGQIVYDILKAVQVFWNALVDGNEADFVDAATDDTLWSNITCAIYNAIVTDGAVTDGNFPALVTAVGAVSYAHAEVITAIVSYLNNLGAAGLEQLQQVGALAVYDCSGCGGGVSTGPPGLPYRASAGTVSVTIPAGSATGSTLVTFTQAFGSAPVVTVGVDNPNLIASVASLAAGSFLATLKSAVHVDVDTTADVFWRAELPGSS